MGYFYNVFHSEIFQGRHRKRRYFEGWYFKMAAPTGQVMALIPGMALDATGEGHSFIQVIDGSTAQTHYLTFPLEQFQAHPRKLEVTIGPNYFSPALVRVDLRPQGLDLYGEVYMSQLTPLPSNWRMPGVMGWYGYIPMMECYHGLVSLDHTLSGALHWKNQAINFNGGRGYLEKDWGTSFPRSYVWLQSNHFEAAPGTSIMVSVAHIPWLGSHFIGFLGLLHVGGTTHRFTTYTGARLQKTRKTNTGVEVSLRGSGLTLDVRVVGGGGGILKAPHLGSMKREIAESIDAQIHVTLSNAKGTVLFEGTGIQGGLEMVGPIADLGFL
jgi:hypothetical protein